MITSAQNTQVKNIIKLNQKAKARREQKLFVAEGRKMFLEAPENLIDKIYVAEFMLDDEEVMEKVRRFSWESVENGVFRQMCDTQTPQGILTVLRQPSYQMQDLLKEKNPLIMVLEDLQEKKVFRLCDIHLDHLGVQARTLGLSQILKKMDDAVLFAGAPVILAGDFNAEPDGEEFAVMRERTDYVNYTEGIGITYHGFEPEDEPERIDYIYIKKAKEGYAGLTCRSVKKWEDRDKEVWLSDHYPICAELEWINL